MMRRTTLIAASLALILFGSSMSAEAQRGRRTPQAKPKTAQAVKIAPGGRTTPPPLAPPESLQLPEVIEKSLPNGLRIVLLEDHRQPALWLRLAVPAGSIRDPKEKVGLAAMTAELLDKGTQTRTEAQIADTVDGLGASLGASADEDYIVASASGLSAHGDTLFDLLADIALHPTFPQKELDRVRTRTLNSLSVSLADPGTMAGVAISRLVYGAHPYGNLTSGTPQTLPDIASQDLANYHRAYFAPNVATLFLVGDITPEQAVQQAERFFGKWERKEIPELSVPAPPARPEATEITLLDRPGAAQTEIRIGTITTGYNDPKRIIGSVATTVLGLGQFEGRLTKEIRVKRGLTYGAGSFIERNKEAGSFQISTFTKNESTSEVLKIALAEADKLTRELTPKPELQERKNFLLGSFAVGVATPAGVLARLIPATLYGDGPSDLTKYTERVQAVTPEQIRELMQTLQPRTMRVVLVGDAKAIESTVAPLGKVTKIPFDSVDLLSPTLKPDPSQQSQEPAPTAEEAADGKARLEAAALAHGGDAFLNLHSAILKGKGELTPPGQQGDVKLPVESATYTLVPPDKSRLDLKTSFGDIILASPGGAAGGWVSLMGQVQDAPGRTSGAGDPFDVLRRALRKGYALRPLPEQENGKPVTDADGKALQGFAATDEKGQTTRIYVEPDTNRVRRMVNRGAQGEYEVLFSDYRAVDGVQLPGTMRVQQNGRPYLRLTFSEFLVNKPVDSGLFIRPRK